MWSIGTAHRDDELKTMSYYYAPGPGTYDQVHDGTYKQQNPAWRQGSSVRPPLYSGSHPGLGPGSYEVKESIGKIETNKDGKVQPSFSKAKRGHSENKGVATVGPGSYNPKKFAKAYPQFSFGYKGEGIYSNIRAHTPGPGAYEFKDPFELMGEEAKKPGNEKTAFLRTAPQAFSQPKESAFGDHSTPGPGQNYNPNVDNYSFRYFAPTYSFGTSTRDDLYNSEAKNFPGPGKYSHPGGIKTKSGFTILGRHPSKGNSSDTPAPNVYNQSINPLRKTAPSFR